MAMRGLVILGLPPILLINVAVRSENLATLSMSLVAVLGAGYPFVRTLLGGVWLEGGSIRARNPFSTVSLPVGGVGCVTTRALWQNLYVVAALEDASRGPGNSTRVVAVPAVDAALLAQLLGKPVRDSNPA